MFANGRIVFPGLEFFRVKALILRDRVVVTGTGARDEFNFVTHSQILPRLDALTGGSEVGDDLLDTVLVYDTKALVRHAQTHETLLGFDPKTLVLQVRQKASSRLVVRMGNVIASHRTLSSHLANLGHEISL